MRATRLVGACAIAAWVAGPGCDARDHPASDPIAAVRFDPAEAAAEIDGGRPGASPRRPGFGPDVRTELGALSNHVHVDLPESLWSPSPGFRFTPVLGDPGRARLLAGGYEAENASARVRGSWRIAGDVMAMELAVENAGAASLRDVRANVCLHLHRAPAFRHDGARQVFFFHRGHPLEFSELPARDGYLASRVRVREEAGETADAGLRGSSPLFSRSRVLADDGVIVATSADGRFALGTLWEDARAVFHNMLSGRQCIHSNPAFGDLAPGARVTRRGWLVVVEGGPGEARRRLLELLRGAP
jgi:hypothetical protein